MRHFYSTMMLAMIASASFAQSPARVQSAEFKSISPIHQLRTKMPAGAKESNLKLPDFSKNRISLKARALKAEQSVLPIITEQPEGTLHDNYYGVAAGHEVFWGSLTNSSIDGSVNEFVINDNGDVYIKNAISTLPANTWIKGSKAEGDTIVFNFPQNYYQQAETDEETGEETGNLESYYAFRMIKENTSDGQTLIPDPTSQTIKYLLRNDSLIRLDNLLSNGVYLGLATTDGEWVGYDDYLSLWTKQKDKLVELPASAKPETYEIDFYSNSEEQDSRIINVAFDGNDVYISNLTDSLPNSWVKGKVEGKKIKFSGKTYMGIDNYSGYYAYFTPIGVEKVYSAYWEEYVDSTFFADEIEFDYNAAAKYMKSSGLFAVNAGKNEIYTINLYDEPTIKSWKEVAGTPGTPELYEFMAFDEEYGYGCIRFFIDRKSTEGSLLNQDKLYYNIFFDDEKFTFEPDEYIALKESITDVPINFADNYDIYKDGTERVVYYYIDGFTTVGIQEVYKDGDKEYRGEMAKYTINGDDFTGIDNANIEDFSHDIKGVSYTDMSGRTISKPAKGIYLKTVKFADGSQKTIKFVKR